MNAAPIDLPVPAAGCDCRRCPLYLDNPDAIEPICSGCSSECQYCSCLRGSCNGCALRCGRRTDIAAWIRDVGATLTFDDLRLTGFLPTGVPQLVPHVDTAQMSRLDAALGWGAYAVTLRRVFSPDSHTLTPVWADAPAREVLGLAPQQKAVLVCTGKDALLEAWWSRRRRDRLIERIAVGGWDVVIAPDYSMYANQPRAEHLINFRRNLLVACEFAAAGVTAVPFLHWLRREDLDRYLTWIDAQAPLGPPAIALNLQTCRSDAAWQDALPGLALLAAEAPATVPVMVHGTSRPHRIVTLRQLFGERLYLLSHHPLQAARYGGLLSDHGRIDHPARTEDLFAANVRYMAGLLEGGR